MELVLNGKPFPVFAAPLSKRRRRMIARANERRAQALLALYEEYPDVKAYHAIPKDERPPQADTLALRTILFNQVYYDIEEDYNFSVYRLFIDLDQLTAEQKAAVLTEIDSDFWQDQESEAIGADVIRFLSRPRSTGSANSGSVPDVGNTPGETDEANEAEVGTDDAVRSDTGVGS